MKSDEFKKDLLFYNLDLFIKRFPDLSGQMNLNSKTVIDILQRIPDSYKLEKSKFKIGDGVAFTANINGKFIHSKYNPIKEAEKTLDSEFFKNSNVKNSCVFFGLGLGYLPELYAKKNNSANLIIIEPDIFIFLMFLLTRNLKEFFAHKNLTILLGAYPKEVLDFFSVMEQDNIPVFRQPALMEVSLDWFKEFDALKKRKNDQDNLNKNTLKKFGKIWLKNFFKNLNKIESLKGIIQFNNIFKNQKALVIAAGPSLNDHLQVIKEVADKFVLIVTDTAVRACLRENIIPDFVLLMDSQYWNFLHLSDLNIKDSILVTESCVYPAVFRIKTKKTFLCTSSFPLAQYIEDLVGKKGKLVTGGSVATAAWDFARVLGCTEIIMIGLDLAFPNFQTHFWGSRFEENSNTFSSRFIPTETTSHCSLYSAMPEKLDGYENKVITDKRMKMYAWWFESKLAEFQNIKTYNLLPQGLKIPNMPALLKVDFFKIANNSNLNKTKKNSLVNSILKNNSKAQKTKQLKTALNELGRDLEIVKELTGRAIELTKDNPLSPELSKIDSELRVNKTNKIIGFDLLLATEKNDDVYSIINSTAKSVLNILSRF